MQNVCRHCALDSHINTILGNTSGWECSSYEDWFVIFIESFNLMSECFLLHLSVKSKV